MDPYYDPASKKSTIRMKGRNVGDLLNRGGVTWGWFQGGFGDPSRKHKNVGGADVLDFIPHHEPFQYYEQTANPNHLPPSSPAAIGHDDRANHQYDLRDFWAAPDSGNLPAVSFPKAAGYQQGHAGYSDPLDEREWLVDTINRLQKLPSWASTTVFISWDDSDGWYDHVTGPIRNFVASTVSDQSSIIRFIEDNWSLGRIGDQAADDIAGPLDNMFDFSRGYQNTTLFLIPRTGKPVAQTEPLEADGYLDMSVEDLAQSLDVQLHSTNSEYCFTYETHLVTILPTSDRALIDSEEVGLGAPMKKIEDRQALAVNNLAAALGLEAIQLSADEIVFKPKGQRSPIADGTCP